MVDMKVLNALAVVVCVMFTLCDSSSPPCRLSCPRGQVMDTTRCRCISIIKERRPPGNNFPLCKRRNCPRNCPYGTESSVDGLGCSVCRCRSGNPRNACRGQDFRPCGAFCPNGLQTDQNGCQLCRCKPVQRCGALCRNLCPFGRVNDANGCPTCTCKKSNKELLYRY